VTRPRAADYFATIRARMEELRRDRAPRAANNFASTERAWKNCAASALRCRRHETPRLGSAAALQER
jgi:hypothetical protein